MKEINKLIQIYGNQTNLAIDLGISNQAVYKWVKQGFVPEKRVLGVYELAKDKKTPAGFRLDLVKMLEEARECR